MNSSNIVMFEEEYDEQQDIARSRFADMLHDTERNQKYYLGLETAINKMHERGLKADVLDIGTGTGLLSMMAVKLGADSVYACEAFMPAAKCALKIMEDNGMKDSIKLIKKRSTDIEIGRDMEKKANILVTEVFDTELIGEGAIEIFNHAHEKLLEKDCIVVPDHAEMYVQIVESALVNSWNKIKAVANSDGEILLKTPQSLNDCRGETAVHDLQLSQLPQYSFRALTAPMVVFQFDFTGKTKLEKNRINKVKAMCNGTGLAQAVFMWWDLKMDVDHKIVLSCSPFWAHPDTHSLQEKYPNELPPNTIPWRDHWLQAIYYLPKSNYLLGEGKEVHIVCNHDEFSLWFDISQNTVATENARPHCTCGLHLACSRTKIGQLNDNLRNKKFLSHLESWHLKNGTLLILNGKCSLIGLAASVLQPSPSQVVILEEDKMIRNVFDAYIETNKLWNVNIKENLQKIDLKSVTHLLIEPSVPSILPWDDFSFFSFLMSHKEKLNANIRICPHKVVLKGLPVRFLNLFKIIAPVRKCEGFSMETYDTMISTAISVADDPIEMHSLWEYPCYALGKVETLLEINLNALELKYENRGKLEYAADADCNGIAFWLEWQLNESPKSVISTGPVNFIEQGKLIEWTMYNRQGVHLFNQSPETISWDLTYNLDTNKLKLIFK